MYGFWIYFRHNNYRHPTNNSLILISLALIQKCNHETAVYLQLYHSGTLLAFPWLTLCRKPRALSELRTHDLS